MARDDHRGSPWLVYLPFSRLMRAVLPSVRLFRNENALTVIGMAENGEVLAGFDPLFPDRAEGTDARLPSTL